MVESPWPKHLGLVLLGAAAVLALLFGAYQLSNARSFQLFGELIARVETEKPLVALTFDDGPTPEYTSGILDILREKNVPATFFLTGSDTEKNPNEARAIVQAGHEVGNHSYSHSRMVLMSPATVRDEVERTDAAIRAVGYQGEILFRPPYGKKLVTLPWYLSSTNRKTIMWNVEPESFPEIANDAKAIADHVVDRAKPGSIILMHLMYPSREPSRQALPGIIDRLRERGHRFVTVSELIATKQADVRSGSSAE